MMAAPGCSSQPSKLHACGRLWPGRPVTTSRVLRVSPTNSDAYADVGPAFGAGGVALCSKVGEVPPRAAPAVIFQERRLASPAPRKSLRFFSAEDEPAVG